MCAYSARARVCVCGCECVRACVLAFLFFVRHHFLIFSQIKPLSPLTPIPCCITDDAYQYDDNGESEKNDDGTPTTNSQHGVWIFKLDGRGGEAGNSSSMTSVGENSAQWTATVYNGAKFGPGRVDAGPKALVLEGNSQYVKIDGGIQVGSFVYIRYNYTSQRRTNNGRRPGRASVEKSHHLLFFL